jgi:hypothetical protein
VKLEVKTPTKILIHVFLFLVGVDVHTRHINTGRMRSLQVGDTHDNCINISRVTYTQTPMPLRKYSKRRKSTQWCLDKEKTDPNQNIRKF